MSTSTSTRKNHHHHNTQSRTVQISKSLSSLLRHRATQERIPISPDGFVRCSDLLKWQKLKSLKCNFADVVDVVEDNLSGKGRFALRYDSTSSIETANGESRDDVNVPTETEKAIAVFRKGDVTNPEQYLIRATQGHSLRLEDTTDLLTPIRLDDAEGLPRTVVHGTFYGAWERILQSGGLKRMRRTHVHLATGPGLEEVMSGIAGDMADGDGDGGQEERVEKRLVENRVRSGMRSDAQILVYVDLRRALEAGVPFFRSENGVVLTEGVEEGEDGEKMLGREYWDVVVEVKKGLGVLWRRGDGVVKELPAELKGKGGPRGKDGGRGGGHGRGRGRGKARDGGRREGEGEGEGEGGGRQRLQIERREDETAE